MPAIRLTVLPFLVGSMAQIGKYNTLEVTSIMDFGVYLDGENLEAILLPKTQVPPDTELGDWINVFIYLDSEDRLIATSLKPKAEVGTMAGGFALFRKSRKSQKFSEMRVLGLPWIRALFGENPRRLGNIYYQVIRDRS